MSSPQHYSPKHGARANSNDWMDDSSSGVVVGGSDERLPLLGASNTRRGRPFTTPASSQPPMPSPTKYSTGNNGNGNCYNVKGGKTTATINQPIALDANRHTFQRQSRPRKAVAEFRKKHRQTADATATTEGGILPVTSWQGRVGIHLHVDEIDIDKVMQVFTSPTKKDSNWNAVDHFEVVRLWQSEPPYIGHELWSEWPLSEDEDNGGGEIDWTAAMPEIYVFSFGVIVFWNFPNEDYEKKWIDNRLLNELENACGDLYKEDEIESAMDSVSFQYGGGYQKFSIKQDHCILSTRDEGEKLAVSFALAKSSLLSLYELRVQHVIERNSHLPQEMVENGRIHMSTKDMTREVGRLFLVKHGINLDQSLIDTPEEFWEDDRFETTYDTTLKYMKVGKRLDLVNSRLDMIGELHNKIMEENHTHHAEILEWIIIWLIVVEVLLDMLHLGFY